MEEKQPYGRNVEVDIVVRNHDGSADKIGDAVMTTRTDGCSISLGLFRSTTEIKLMAGEQYDFVIKPGTEKTIYKPER